MANKGMSRIEKIDLCSNKNLRRRQLLRSIQSIKQLIHASVVDAQELGGTGGHVTIIMLAPSTFLSKN